MDVGCEWQAVSYCTVSKLVYQSAGAVLRCFFVSSRLGEDWTRLSSTCRIFFPWEHLRDERVCVCDRSIKKKVLKIPFLLIIRYIANTFFNFSERFKPTKQAWTYFVIIGRQVSKQRLYKLAITTTNESPLLEFVFILPEWKERKGKESIGEKERDQSGCFRSRCPREVWWLQQGTKERGREGGRGKVEIGRWDGRRRSQRERENLISR